MTTLSLRQKVFTQIRHSAVFLSLVDYSGTIIFKWPKRYSEQFFFSDT